MNTSRTRSEWIEATKDRLDELDRTLSDLEAKAKDKRSEVSDEIEGRIRATRSSLDAAEARWMKLRDTAAEVWEAVSEEISTAWDANREALERSVDEIRNALGDDRPKAAEGDTVRVRYEGSFDDGTPFKPRTAPFEFTLGDTAPMPGIAEVIEGLAVGEAASVTIPSEDMFGPRKQELILRIPVTVFPGNKPPQLGDRFELRPEDGEPVKVTVRRVIDGLVEVDANHPLAGSDLHLDLELVGLSASES